MCLSILAIVWAANRRFRHFQIFIKTREKIPCSFLQKTCNKFLYWLLSLLQNSKRSIFNVKTIIRKWLEAVLHSLILRLLHSMLCVISVGSWISVVRSNEASCLFQFLLACFFLSIVCKQMFGHSPYKNTWMSISPHCLFPASLIQFLFIKSKFKLYNKLESANLHKRSVWELFGFFLPLNWNSQWNWIKLWVNWIKALNNEPKIAKL